MLQLTTIFSLLLFGPITVHKMRETDCRDIFGHRRKEGKGGIVNQKKKKGHRRTIKSLYNPCGPRHAACVPVGTFWRYSHGTQQRITRVQNLAHTSTTAYITFSLLYYFLFFCTEIKVLEILAFFSFWSGEEIATAYSHVGTDMLCNRTCQR